ncbi:MAG: hypothetical protein C5B51_07055 [Terriglobia bacterium]|nr:MAG: hypothetical protein C5B51_07055 [Terriglobia bacterium]
MARTGGAGDQFVRTNAGSHRFFLFRAQTILPESDRIVETMRFWILTIAAFPLCAQTPSPAPQVTRPPAAAINELGTRGAGPRATVKGPVPRRPDGKPDLAGVWNPDSNFIGDIRRALKPGETLPIQPWAQTLRDKRRSKEDPEANCLPTGVPRMAPYPWSIAESGKVLFFVFEGNIHSWRQIFMDGRAHPKDPNPTWYGHSVGHWEGDTLVVDTIGFNDKFWFDFEGHPHTDKLHTIERYTRTDLGTLVNEVTIDDPGAYTKPFTITSINRLEPSGDLMEYICQENNKDVSHIDGPAHLE